MDCRPLYTVVYYRGVWYRIPVYQNNKLYPLHYFAATQCSQDIYMLRRK